MAEQRLNIGVIGLGVMGRRMLTRLNDHPRLRVTRAWDADPVACAAACAVQAGLEIAAGAESLIATPGLHGLYIATPPAAHIALSERAFDAGLAVFCEKPLSTDFTDAQRCIDRIAREGQRAAVNFALASSPGLTMLGQTFGPGGDQSLGALQAIEIELSFAAWPRAWQAGAGAWLSERAEGGFSREVLSHFIFVLQRVLGPAELLRCEVQWPADGRRAETALQAELRVAGVPVSIQGQVGGELADFNRMSWQGASGAIELGDWFGLARRRSAESGWELMGDPAQLRSRSQTEQLDQWTALVEGRPHSLPGFAEALAVQQTIESLLAAKNA
ncbi:Gfo/Idh/MocA family oxidoreductase [Pelomonas sp. V22]|uniref:Gfo/Idh/MocA family protein n=1 Tax=Pelomonas sp. V22 TaxID=2822139 RepID=UPI0024A8896D|nr:Gfo/Idh/MocA family oxidoreductase [Pelomonas sp. V22]MDI4635273.1 Gfo/Idh/MocA family oxidoreductase [Pelomonas sp. V22]